MNYDIFKKNVAVSEKEMFLETLAESRESIRIKKEKTIVKNLQKIFKATLKISNKKGFKAMSMRDLSRETGISLGALYAYFENKDDILNMLQSQRILFVTRIFENEIARAQRPLEKLRTVIKTHLFLSEFMQPWFYFSFMESKNLSPKEKQRTINAERDLDKIFESILDDGKMDGVFNDFDPVLTVEAIKALNQDWYLKRSKFRSQKISVDQYADFVIQFVESHLGVDKGRAAIPFGVDKTISQ